MRAAAEFHPRAAELNTIRIPGTIPPVAEVCRFAPVCSPLPNSNQAGKFYSKFAKKGGTAEVNACHFRP